MLAGPEDMPSKAAKGLPEEAKVIFAETYNHDFAWRCQEAHALKAAWRAIHRDWIEGEDGTWTRRQ